MRTFAWVAGISLPVVAVLVAAGVLLSQRETPPGGGLPSPWQDADVGSPALAGSTSDRDGVFAVTGSGADVWLGADQFHYVYRPFNGDGEIAARVTSQTDTSPWAKAGVIIKDSTATGSRYAAMLVTPGHGFVFQYHYNGEVVSGASRPPDAWVRLVRSGRTITGYSSTNGTDWTEVGSVDLAIAAKATAGLLVTSHDAATLSTATFDSVTGAQE